VVADKASPTAGRIESVDGQRSVLHAGSNSLDELALYVALKGIDFEVLEPPELVEHVATLGARLTRAATAERPG
jgi:WYL domain-containing protein